MFLFVKIYTNSRKIENYLLKASAITKLTLCKMHLCSIIVLLSAPIFAQFSFTPDEYDPYFGRVTQLRGSIATGNNSHVWMIGASPEQDLTNIRMALEVEMFSDTYCEVSNFNIHFNTHHGSEGDAGIIIQAGSQYISVMFENDGGMFINGDAAANNAGIGIYPRCNSNSLPKIPNNSTNITNLFSDSADTNTEYSPDLDFPDLWYDWWG